MKNFNRNCVISKNVYFILILEIEEYLIKVLIFLSKKVILILVVIIITITIIIICKTLVEVILFYVSKIIN
jgi:hypothetical protein